MPGGRHPRDGARGCRRMRAGRLRRRPMVAGSGRSSRSSRRARPTSSGKGVHAGAVKAGEELGVEILWKGPLKRTTARNRSRSSRDSRPGGIGHRARAARRQGAARCRWANAVRAGIPVVVFDSELDSDDHVSLVETDNYAGGRLAGDHLATPPGRQGQRHHAALHEGSASTTEREQGFLDAMRARARHRGRQLQPVRRRHHRERLQGEREPADGAEGRRASRARDLLPERVDDVRHAARAAEREPRRQGEVRRLRQLGQAGAGAWRRRSSTRIVVQDPYQHGLPGREDDGPALEGEQVEKHIDTGATLVTKDNMDQPELQRRLHPGR